MNQTEGRIVNSVAERSAIGAMLNDDRALKHAKRLTQEDFAVREYYEAFGAIQRLIAEGAPVDLVTVCGRLNNDPSVTNALIDAAAMTPVTINADEYVTQVLEASMRRKASSICEALYKAMGDQLVDPQAAINTAKAKLFNLGLYNAEGAWLSAAEVAMRTYAELERRKNGDIKPVASGISDLDDMTGGFYPGELTIVGAKPGVGKSVFGMTVALNAAAAGYRTGIVSLEMMDTQYGQRMLSNISGVDGMKMRKNELKDQDWELLAEATARLGQYQSAFTFRDRYIEDLQLSLQDRVERDGLDLLVVDYLQLMRTRQRTESERLAMAAISWALKTIAIDYRIPVIALAQLRRPGQGEANKMPTMRDLRESGNLEADADNIILLHEPASSEDSQVNPKDVPYFADIKARGHRYIAMKVEKQRQGSTGTISLVFKPQTMKYVAVYRGVKP